MLKHLYSTSNAGIGDIGTLYSARNAVKARQVSKDPQNNFYATSDLLQKFTEATLVAGAVSYFSMDGMNGQPMPHVYDGDKTDRKSVQSYMKTVTEDSVFRHIFPDVPHVQEPSLQCPDCGRQYKKKGFLSKHRRVVHGFTEPVLPLQVMKEL